MICSPPLAAHDAPGSALSAMPLSPPTIGGPTLLSLGSFAPTGCCTLHRPSVPALGSTSTSGPLSKEGTPNGGASAGAGSRGASAGTGRGGCRTGEGSTFAFWRGGCLGGVTGRLGGVTGRRRSDEARQVPHASSADRCSRTSSKTFSRFSSISGGISPRKVPSCAR